MIFSGSMEYEKRYNQEVQERPSDNVELPKVIAKFFLMKSDVCPVHIFLPGLNSNNIKCCICTG